MATAMLQEAMASVRELTSIDVEIALHERTVLGDSIRALEEAREFSFGVESANNEEIAQKLRDLRLARRLQEGIMLFQGRFPVMPWRVLEWENPKDGFPRLVPFHLSSPTFHLCWSAQGHGDQLVRQPTKTFELMTRLGRPDFYDHLKPTDSEWLAVRGKGKYELVVQFKGVIPGRVRERIRQVRHEFDDMLLIAEPEKWEVNKVIIPDPDPIVVGVAHDHLWFVDKFDLTSVEEIALSAMKR